MSNTPASLHPPSSTLLLAHLIALAAYGTTSSRCFATISKHILNAQVSIRAPCCQKFFDCPECHNETQDHPLRRTMEMAFICKKCKKAFRKDMTRYEEADEYCPHCDNHYVIEAKEPQAMIGVEGEDARVDSRMLKDDRVKTDGQKSLFVQQDGSHRLG